MAGMGRAALCQRGKSGTKVLIEDYINEIRDSLNYLAPRDFPGIPWAERIEFSARQPLLRAFGPDVEWRWYPGILPLWRDQDADRAGFVPGGDFRRQCRGLCGIHRGHPYRCRKYLQLFENNYLARALTANRGNIKIGLAAAATRST